MPDAPLAVGYHSLPRGCLANVVTCLEIRERPLLRPAPVISGLSLQRMTAGDTARFRNLFRLVGQDIMWFSRLVLTDDALAAVIGDSRVESLVLMRDGADIGLLELDFRQEGECELSFFGLVPEVVGTGLGRILMNEALSRAWSQPITRLWVHTCSFDHPGALAFYQRSGFQPYKIMVEVHHDPRLSGHLPLQASAQVPLIGGPSPDFQTSNK